MNKQWICSERAHLMCPNMYFGILAYVKAEADRNKIKDSLDEIANAHPFLRSVIQYGDTKNNLYYNIGEHSTIQLVEKESINTLWEDYKKIGEKEWNVFENGLLKVLVYPIKDEMKILFVAHHLLVDGRGLLELVNEFVNLYVEDQKPAYVGEKLIKGIEDLPEKSDLSGISRYLVKSMNKKWRKEQTCVTYEEYARFSDDFVRKNPVSREIKAVETQKLGEMKALCKINNISINDLLMANMFLNMKGNKLIIAADVRNKLKCYRKGALGNYASAFGIVSKKKTTDVIEKAKDVHKLVRSNVTSNRKLMLILSCYLTMDQTLIDAAAIATLGDFKSKAAKFVGASMFGYEKRDGVSITNLGRITSSSIINATFIPPASPATTQTIGVLTVNDNMQLCSSYYENAISLEEVRRQLSALSII